ncbi:hypothetical protein ACFYRL_26020 [Streptomyces goshikiensis]|uniref:hypothetical protein n=1 Tax=Streptomyces goshikiensis TaxID=1942 RepID=UPI0036A90925
MDPHPKAPPTVPLATLPLATLPLATLPLPRADARSERPAQPPAGHSTSTTERGSFCLALCTCGWRGPARRSRDLARKDATLHTAG